MFSILFCLRKISILLSLFVICLTHISFPRKLFFLLSFWPLKQFISLLILFRQITPIPENIMFSICFCLRKISILLSLIVIDITHQLFPKKQFFIIILDVKKIDFSFHFISTNNSKSRKYNGFYFILPPKNFHPLIRDCNWFNSCCIHEKIIFPYHFGRENNLFLFSFYFDK